MNRLPPVNRSRGRPWSWIRDRPRLVDGILVAIVFLPAMTSPFADRESVGAGPLLVLSILVVPLQSLPLWWRRSHPTAVWWTVLAVIAVKTAAGLSVNASSVAAVLAIYAVSVYAPFRERMISGAAAIAMIGASAVALYVGFRSRSSDVLSFAGPMLVAWVIGDYIRSRREHFADIVAAHTADRERAAQEERARIARELHDVVTHNVSLMAIQAGAARVSGSSATEALESIERSARDTLSELNKLLGVLRRSTDERQLTPQPGLEDVDSMLKPVRDAGLEVTLRLIGQPRRLPPAVDLSAYRIVQEALTNVLKHANATRVEVVVDYGFDVLTLSVTDNGSGPRGVSSNGHGLVGMRERVQLFGGDVSTHTSELGGFTLRATVPVKA